MKTNCVICLLVILLLNQSKLIGQIKLVQHGSGDLHFLLIPVRWFIYENSDNRQVVHDTPKINTKRLIGNQQNKSDESSASQIHEAETSVRESDYFLNKISGMNFKEEFVVDSEDKIHIESWMIDMNKRSIDPITAENQVILEDWMLKPSEWLR